jgi:hypothetical protein
VAYAEMLVRLGAEERQERITDTGLGMGSFDPVESKRLMHNLSILAGRSKPRKATPADLAASGIAFKRVPRKGLKRGELGDSKGEAEHQREHNGKDEGDDA